MIVAKIVDNWRDTIHKRVYDQFDFFKIDLRNRSLLYFCLVSTPKWAALFLIFALRDGGNECLFIILSFNSKHLSMKVIKSIYSSRSLIEMHSRESQAL